MFFFALLAALTAWGWLALVGLTVAVIIGIEIESGPGTVVLLLLGSAAVWVAQEGLFVPPFSDIVHWFGSHWLTLLVYVGYYVAVGVVWSGIKWYFYNLNKRDEYHEQEDKIRKEWTAGNSDSGYYSSGRYIKTYEEYVRVEYGIPPELKQNKARIISWMTYWPWSAIWTVLNDPIRRLINWLYGRLGKVYTAITNHVFASVNFSANK